jgi:hypothetical protein
MLLQKIVQHSLLSFKATHFILALLVITFHFSIFGCYHINIKLDGHFDKCTHNLMNL